MSPSQSKAMRKPSGVQLGSSHGGLVGLIFTGLAPLASMTQTANPVGSRFDWNAIFVPSGDQAGARLTDALFVRFTTFPPSVSMTKMSILPPQLRSDANAIRSPAGDHAG